MANNGPEESGGSRNRGTPPGSGAPRSRQLRVVGLIGAALAFMILVAVGLGGNANAQTTLVDDTPTVAPTAVPPTATAVPVPLTIALTPSTQALSCGASASVGINLTVGAQNAANGTQAIITPNLGTASPSTVTTTNGAGSFTYFAPPTGAGTVTITATSMGSTQTTTINLFCGSGGPPPQLGAALATPMITCNGGQASVVFSWTPIAGASVQWVDLSLTNDGFPPDSFVGFGPLNGTTNQIQWNNLLAGRTHFWRVSAGVPGVGWVFSQTGSFTPCGSNTAPGTTTFVCTGGGRANVTFGVGPAPAGTSASFLDISLFNNGFAPSSFIGTNVSGVSTTFVWQGLLANATHWWRVNNLTPLGWVTTSSGAFTATC